MTPAAALQPAHRRAGLLPGVIVDQHFDQRARYGRLLSIVATSPNLLGMGIDEDTAAEITDGRGLTVVGTGAVFVVDARGRGERRRRRPAATPRCWSPVQWCTRCRPALPSTCTRRA